MHYRTCDSGYEDLVSKRRIRCHRIQWHRDVCCGVLPTGIHVLWYKHAVGSVGFVKAGECPERTRI